MKYIIDRFEGDIAACEDETGHTLDIKKSELPKIADVGDVVIFENNRYRVAKKETNLLRKEIEDLMDEVWED